ncbi:molybdopterin-binding protein [soil metagenome]
MLRIVLCSADPPHLAQLRCAPGEGACDRRNVASRMTPSQRLPSSLTSLEAALALLRDGVVAVTPCEVALADAQGSIAATMRPRPKTPARDIAIADGFALASRDLVGASSYAPLPLSAAPVWVEAGDTMPDGTDCVVDADLVDASGPLIQVVAEAIPGEGVRRAGSDGLQSAPDAGHPIRPLDLLAARAAGLTTLMVRQPRLRLINVPAADGSGITAQLIADLARAEGADVTRIDAHGRDAGSIAAALDSNACDLLVTIGGSGVGRSDATIAALAQAGTVPAHGLALQPGRSTAIGKINTTPVIALPGAPDQALAAWWTLALPLLDRLSGRVARATETLPLARKIASSVGVAEIALLQRVENNWLPLAVGELALAAIARADAWCTVPAGSEGYAAAAPVDAYMLGDRM